METQVNTAPSMSPAQLAGRRKGAHAKKRFITRGTPLKIAAILENHPQGLLSHKVHELLLPQMPAGWNVQNTSNQLSGMNAKRYVSKWYGGLWKLGPKSMAGYHAIGKHSKHGHKANGAAPARGGDRGVAARAALAAKRAATKVSGTAPTALAKALEEIEAQFDAARQVFGLMKQLAADLETQAFKTKQREQAVEAARKLLAQAGV